MRTLSADIIAEIQKVHGDQPFAWLAEIEVTRTTNAREVFMITDYPSAITFPTGNPLGSFDPYPLEVGLVESDGEGTIPSMELTISNIGREHVRYLHEADSVIGKECWLQLVNVAQLDAADLVVSQRFDITGAAITAEVVQLNLELISPHDLQFPQEVIRRDRCRFRYGDERCAFPVTAISPQTCDKAPTTCALRGDYEVSVGRPRLHPLRFGGYLGANTGVRA